MPRCRVDTSIERKVVDGFDFPLGVYPIEPLQPREGYTVAFESADGGAEDPDEQTSQWEEWPDRYVWDIVVKASRVESLVRSFMALLPGRIYPILDVLGSDAYREIDPYIADEPIGQERLLDALRRFRAWFYEDGLVGFGAMSDEPFYYIFVDEHKIVTVRAETSLKERIEKLLAAFDLQEVESLSGADAAVHEHRGVLDAPDDRPDLLTSDEIVEHLRDEWGLSLNVDGDRNVDEAGNDLGMTGWRCLVRRFPPDSPPLYAEVFLAAECLNAACELAADAVEALPAPPGGRRPRAAAKPPAESDAGDLDVLIADRLSPEDFAASTGKAGEKALSADQGAVLQCRWLS
ncbi:MAG: hypothetical protein JNJ48_05600 [Phycisphaerae bacterium]|nr:hypothetical protein [Phycisphaerae bacterium]